MSFFLCIFAIPIFSVIILFNKQLALGLFDPLFFLIYFLLAGAHNWGPVFYYLTSSREKARVRQLQPHIGRYLILIMLVPILGYLISAIYYEQNLPNMKLLIFSIFAFVYLVWNTFHFTAQQKGILKLLKRNGQDKWDKYFDIATCHILLTIMPVAVWFSIGYRISFLDINKELQEAINIYSKQILSSFNFIYLSIFIILFIYISYRRFHYLIVFQYISILIQSLGIYLVPSFFTLIIYSATHWLQENYFISVYTQNEFRKYKLLSFVFAAVLSISFYYLYFHLLVENRVTVFGEVTGMSGMSFIDYIFFALVNSFLLAVNYLHFYLDGFLHRKKIRIKY